MECAMINVLWVDDQAYDEKGEPKPLYYTVTERGYDAGIFVQAYQNYDEALDALTSEPHRWSAIILDICDERAEHGETEDGFSEIYSEIEKFQVRNNQPEPYIFVYSGDNRFSTKEQQSIIRKRDYAKRVYVKGSIPELKEMFADIKTIVEVSPYYKIQQKYHDIFSAVESLEWEKENKEILWKIIVSVENGKSDPSLLNDMRKLLEGEILGLFEDLNIFPFPSRDFTLNNESTYISMNKKIPVFIQRAFHSLSAITNDGSHGKKATTTSADIMSGKAPYLLRSCMFELFNVIIWQNNLFSEKTDDEIRQLLENPRWEKGS